MDFTMGVGVNSLILLVSLQVRHMHRNHRSLFLLNVQKLNQAMLQGVVKVHRFVGLELHHSDMTVLYPKLSILDDKQRSLDPACISVESDFFVLDVSHDGDFFRDFKLASKLLDAANKVVGIVMSSNPVTVDENFDITTCTNH
jgi:hypothetical protein